MARWAGTVAWVAVASALEFRESEASVVWAAPEVGLQAKAVRELVPEEQRSRLRDLVQASEQLKIVQEGPGNRYDRCG